MMKNKSIAFENTCREYLEQISAVDMREISDKLGVETEGDEAIITFFGSPYRVSPRKISDLSGMEPSHAVTVVLCKYLLSHPETGDIDHDRGLVSYRDFKDGAPFVGAFTNNAERPIARNFANRGDVLKRLCIRLGGYPPEADLPYDVSMRFDALPRVPIYLLFNDQDEEFPAQCSLLFEKNAREYLDMECLAIVGWCLSEKLIQTDRGKPCTLV